MSRIPWLSGADEVSEMLRGSRLREIEFRDVETVKVR